MAGEIAGSVVVVTGGAGGIGAATARAFAAAGARVLVGDIAIHADDIAAMFLFLAGSGGRNITGQTIVVDGGATTVIRPSAHY